MNDSPLERFITHPKRNWIVTTVTFVTGLLFLLPSVDAYNLEQSRLDELSAELEQAHENIASFKSWQQRIEQQREMLEELESRAFVGAEVEAFRSGLVNLVRESECTMRRVRLSEPRYRAWMARNDDPLLDRPPTHAEGETPYFLETRQLALSVEGHLDRVQNLLGKLHATERLVHSAAISVRQVDGASEEVALDLDLVLFNLVLKSSVER